MFQDFRLEADNKEFIVRRCCHIRYDRGAISGIDWEELPDDICNAIGDALEGIQWDQVFESAGELLGTAFGAALDLGGAIGSKLDNALEEFKGWFMGSCIRGWKIYNRGVIAGNRGGTVRYR